MTVSRWENGDIEPTAESYLRLGNLSEPSGTLSFWGRAGLLVADIERALPAMEGRFSDSAGLKMRTVNAGAGKIIASHMKDFVALPILPVRAATLGEKAEQVDDIDRLKSEAVWAAPASWCPNPRRTISLHVKGNSMSPLILDGYIIAIDRSEVSRERLVGKIVVAWNRSTKQLVVSRLLQFDGTYALVSDQRANKSLSLVSESEWRIVGKVLWWAGKEN
jgi:Peptidase S24-like